MRKNLLHLILVLAFSGAGMSAALAGDKVWVGLYFAQNSEPAQNAKVAPEHLRHRLHQVFGYHHYELVKADEVNLHEEWAHWFIPRKDFFLRIEPLPNEEGEPRRIDYEIYKDGFIVAKGKYEPHEETPLFINGPDFKQGRFIFVIEARQ